MTHAEHGTGSPVGPFELGYRAPVSSGVIAGIVLIVLAATVAGKTTQFKGTGMGVLTLGDVALLAGYAILMAGVCTLACVVPTLRALRVQPTEALRTE